MASSSSRFSRRPETRRHSRKAWTPGDPGGGANGGGGADLVSIGSLTTATATGIRWVCVGLRSSTHAFLPTAIEILPPSGKVFHVAYRRHPEASLTGRVLSSELINHGQFKFQEYIHTQNSCRKGWCIKKGRFINHSCNPNCPY